MLKSVFAVLLLWLGGGALLGASASGSPVSQSAGQDQDEPPPWLSNDKQDQLPSVIQLSPADALVGIEPSEIDRLVDGRPLDVNDETLLRVLFRVPQMNLESVNRFVGETEGIDLLDVIAAPELFRLSMFRMRGTALYVERTLVDPVMAERFEMTHYFRVLFREYRTGRVVWLVTPQVPDGWPLEQPIARVTGFDGLLLMTVSDDAPEVFQADLLSAPEMNRGQEAREIEAMPEVQLPQGTPLYVARRLEWFPVTNRLSPKVPFGWRWLSARGFDASLWETLAQSDRKPLGGEDSESFFQSLSALAHEPTDAIIAASQQTLQAANIDEVASEGSTITESLLEHGPLDAFPLFELLKSPNDYRGERMRLSGNIRRITRIEIDQTYFSDRLNLSHYYQIDLFVKLEANQVVRMSTSDGSPGPEFRGKYPVTLCVTQLPPGLEPTDDINMQVSVDAHFFKIWAYPSRYVEQYDPQIRQLGPLFVAKEIEINESSVQPVALTIIAGVVLAISLGGAWLGAWALGRKESRPLTSTHSKEASADADFLKRLADETNDEKSI